MATLNTRNGIYYVDFYDASRTPKRKRLSLKTRSKSVALRLLSEAEDAYRLYRWDPWTQSIEELHDKPQAPTTLESALKLYLEAKRGEVNPSTFRSYESVLRRFVASAGPKTLLLRLTAAQLDAFIRAEDIAQSTKRKRYGLIKVFLRWCEREGHIDRQPAKDVTTPQKPQRIPRAVTPEELKRICDALRADYQRKQSSRDGEIREGELLWFIPMWHFALYTGMRISELARLKWKHINFEERLIYIYRQKSGKQNTIPLNAKAAETLDGVPRGEPDEYVFHAPGYAATERSIECFCNYASSKFRKYRRAAGIDRRLTLHGLRHGHCMMLAKSGKPAYVIKASARHANIQTSMIYVSIQNEHLKAELDDVFS